MPPTVIDASIGISIARQEPEGPAARAALLTLMNDGSAIVVPSHFWLEVTNALLRRHGWLAADIFAVIRDLDEFELETVDLDRPTLLSAMDFAERFGLSSYDATYLALADSIDGYLMTHDGKLRVAAGNRLWSTDQRGRLSETPAVYQHDVTWPSYKGVSAYLAKLRAEALRPTS
jgi:predicted nucleic acid-binding protein